MKLNKLQKINSLNKLFLLGIEKNIFKFKKKIKDFLKEIILNKDEMRKLKQLSLELTDNTINEYLVTIYQYLLNRYPDKECFEIYGNRIRNSEQNGFKEILIDVLESDEFLKNTKVIFENANTKKIIQENYWSWLKSNDKDFLQENSWSWLKSNDKDFLEGAKLNSIEVQKKYLRTDVINKILSYKGKNKSYLEVGVRNLEDNFNLINAETKYCVDPGIEVELNKADFKLESDEFFEQLSRGEILSADYKFDVIFIDGLHLASQVDRDIDNALNHLKEDGFLILHDCNPPTEWHARENYWFYNSPADGAWNGTVWKAFLKRRFDDSLSSCCIDTDWGVGIISKNINIGSSIKIENQFFEYKEFNKKRNHYLNLISFEEFEAILKKKF